MFMASEVVVFRSSGMPSGAVWVRGGKGGSILSLITSTAEDVIKHLCIIMLNEDVLTIATL